MISKFEWSQKEREFWKNQKRLFNMIIEHFAYVLLVQYYSLQFMVSAKQHHKDEEKEWGFMDDFPAQKILPWL